MSSSTTGAATSTRGLMTLAWIIGGIGMLTAGVGIGRLLSGADVLTSVGAVGTGALLVLVAVVVLRRSARA